MPAPRFSILTPVYETPERVLRLMLRSVRAQSNPDWELCLVDDGSAQPHVRSILEQAQAADERIRVEHREGNAGIVPASNDALEMARGEFVVMLDHDDELHPDALLHVGAAIDANPEVDYVYTDEDKVDERGRHFGAFFKPDWSPERMRTQMYTCHLSVFRRSLVEEVGGFDAGFEGSQDWDLVLKVTERARAIAHVPRVLYHWRTLATSAAAGEEAKPWAYEAGRRAVQAHCDRIGLPAEVGIDAEDSGILHLEPRLEREPPVSIVIPTAAQTRDVRFEDVVLVVNCVRAIVERSTYDNYEIVIVAGDAVPPEVTDELREIAGDRLRLVPFTGPFNFSAKINLGAIHSSGEHLLLLNDDIDVGITPNWLDRMVMYSELDGVGAVGGRLIWGDGRLQHVGVGFDGGLPGHTYRGFRGDYNGYANAVFIARNTLAVTGACLMTPRATFERVGGLSTEFPINFNDIDFCLKVHVGGERIVYDADLLLHHFESSSRSPVVEAWEKHALIDRWGPVIGVDPYNNPNLNRGLPRLTSRLNWVKRRPGGLRHLRLPI